MGGGGSAGECLPPNASTRLVRSPSEQDRMVMYMLTLKIHERTLRGWTLPLGVVCAGRLIEYLFPPRWGRAEARELCQFIQAAADPEHISVVLVDGPNDLKMAPYRHFPRFVRWLDSVLDRSTEAVVSRTLGRPAATAVCRRAGVNPSEPYMRLRGIERAIVEFEVAVSIAPVVVMADDGLDPEGVTRLGNHVLRRLGEMDDRAVVAIRFHTSKCVPTPWGPDAVTIRSGS